MTLKAEPRKSGRPASKDWEVLRPDIEQLIAEGHGLIIIARAIGLSQGGTIKLLRRMGLKTQAQVIRAAALEALVAQHADKAAPYNGLLCIKRP